MTEITDEMLEAFRAAWHEADRRGEKGNRVRSGLQAVFDLGKSDLCSHVDCGHPKQDHAGGKCWALPQANACTCQFWRPER